MSVNRKVAVVRGVAPTAPARLIDEEATPDEPDRARVMVGVERRVGLAGPVVIGRLAGSTQSGRRPRSIDNARSVWHAVRNAAVGASQWSRTAAITVAP